MNRNQNVSALIMASKNLDEAKNVAIKHIINEIIGPVPQLSSKRYKYKPPSEELIAWNKAVEKKRKANLAKRQSNVSS